MILGPKKTHQNIQTHSHIFRLNQCNSSQTPTKWYQGTENVPNLTYSAQLYFSSFPLSSLLVSYYSCSMNYVLELSGLGISCLWWQRVVFNHQGVEGTLTLKNYKMCIAKLHANFFKWQEIYEQNLFNYCACAFFLPLY